MYFDQLAAIYDHYTVLRSRITVTLQIDASVTGALVCCLYIDDDTSTVASLTANSERIGAKTFVYTPSVSGQGNPTFTMDWDAKKAFGGDVLADSTLQGSSGASPTEEQFFTMEVGNMVTPATFTFNYWIKVEYDVAWDEYVTIAIS